MLVNFRVENLLSIDNMVTLSMVSSGVDGHSNHIINLSEKQKLLRFSALYGANASGKSSIVKAISYAQRLIVRGFDDKINLSNSYNRNNPLNEEKETKFEFEFMVDNKVYSYGFSVILSKRKFNKEWLYEMGSGEDAIFMINREEEFDTGQYINLSFLSLPDTVNERLKIYIEDSYYDTDNLFLNLLQGREKVISFENGKLFEKIFLWFRDTLEVLGPEDEARESMHSIVSNKGENYKNILGNFLDMNDTGVVAIELVPVKTLFGLPAKIQEGIIGQVSKKENSSATLKTRDHIFIIKNENSNVTLFELKFKHKNGTLYSLYEESDGTVRLIELFSVLYNRDNSKVFVIDEIDRSLHPLLTYNFIESFLEKSDESQLIITTHEDFLLNFELLRKDEIWFVDKDLNGNSSLYSLVEFKNRFDSNILDAYLEGRYGGIPQLKNLFLIPDEEN